MISKLKSNKSQAEIFNFLIVALALTVFFLLFTYYNLNSRLNSVVQVNKFTQSGSSDSKTLSLILGTSFPQNKDFFDLISYSFLFGHPILASNKIHDLLNDRLTILFGKDKWGLFVEQNKINVKVSFIIQESIQDSVLRALLEQDLFQNKDLEKDFTIERNFFVIAKFEPTQIDREEKTKRALTKYLLITKNGYDAKIVSEGELNALFGAFNPNLPGIKYFITIYGESKFENKNTPSAISQALKNNLRRENFGQKPLPQSLSASDEKKLISQTFHIYHNKDIANITLKFIP